MHPGVEPMRRFLIAALFLGVVAAPAAAQSVRYYHLDGIGNVRLITDQNGDILERHDYFPFGEECTTGPCASNPGAGAGEPRKFTAKERDAETGLDYFGARYYHGRIARFTSVDPVYSWQENLVDPQRWNRYTYANNNPYRYVDPDGRSPKAVIVAVKVAIKGGDVYSTVSGIADAGSTLFSTDVTVGTGDRLLAAGSLVLEVSGASDIYSAGKGVARMAGKVDDAVDASKAGDLTGTIYRVPGSATPSGKPYVGRHNKPDPAKTRRSRDGRDRTQAEVVDTYDASDRQTGRVKEQQQIDTHGLENLDNKRNEIRKN